jgi:hypothetical protein
MGMTNQIRNPNDEGGFARIAVLFAASLGGMGACWWAAGPSLGLFFGGLFVVTFLTPAGVLADHLSWSIAGFFVVIVPVAAGWLCTALKTPNTPVQLGEAILVLVAYSLAIAGIALLVARIGIPKLFASAAAIVLGLAWLTWPVWLAGNLVQGGFDRTVQHLVDLHPPLTINGILIGEPAWTERSVAYHLTDLNQDVAIRFPANSMECAAVHGGVGLAFWFAAWRRTKKGSGRVLNSSGPPHTVVPNA